MPSGKSQSLDQKIKQIPDAPGVYRFCDALGKVLYVGKAKSLKKRVKSYFSHKKGLSVKVRKLTEKIKDIQIDVTASEEEALFLEDELIKNYQPPFNILLRDDKTYPYVYISTHEMFPRVLFSYRAMKGEGKYFGPFPSSGIVKNLLAHVRKKYPYRDCPREVGHKSYPESCIYDQMGLCGAPCIKKESFDHYKETIRKICEFLEGKQKSMIRDMYKMMLDVSQKQDFEKAAKIKKQWIMAKKLLTISLAKSDAWSRGITRGLIELKEKLKMTSRIVSMEAYDISNISGELSVGVSVMFRNGKPYKRAYKKFRIKTVKGPNDFAMMEEILYRRFKQILKNKESIPDLILIDGGKGQLTSAIKALDQLGIMGYTIAALAKREELVFVPNQKAPIILGRNSYARKILQALRDESHRFSLAYHRSLRSKNLLGSGLDAIPGIGPVLKRRLLRHFGSVKKLSRSSKKEILKVPGISQKTALNILKGLSKD